MAARNQKKTVVSKIKKKRMKKKEKEMTKAFLNINYTYREQRRRILTMSFKKLMKISNPESILNKAVLINNMLRNIQTQIVFEASGVNDVSISSKLCDGLVT